MNGIELSNSFPRPGRNFAMHNFCCVGGKRGSPVSTFGINCKSGRRITYPTRIGLPWKCFKRQRVSPSTPFAVGTLIPFAVGTLYLLQALWLVRQLFWACCLAFWSSWPSLLTTGSGSGLVLVVLEYKG